MNYTILECLEPACRLRFPCTERDRAVRRCPRCGGSIAAVRTGLLALDEGGGRDFPTLPLELLLDNVRSAFNVGSILRSADAAGARRVHLCGITPTPAHAQVARTALGAQESVEWRYAANGVRAAHERAEAGMELWALEEGGGATSLFELPTPARPVLLMAGNEVTGVEPGLLELCQRRVCLPMRGAKRSLNVAVAVGAALVFLSERMAQGPADGGPHVRQPSDTRSST